MEENIITFEEVTKNILSVLGDGLEGKAEMIARTEMIKALNLGQLKAFKESGFLKNENQQFEAFKFKQDDGKPSKIGGSGTLIDSPPAHPRCRCTIGLDPDSGLMFWIASPSACPICLDIEATTLDGVRAA